MGSVGIRAVTDEEVAHLRDHGWVRLNQLISTELTAQMLERAKAIMGADGSEYVVRPEIDVPTNPWQDRHDIIEEDPCFASIGLSPQMGANAQRLMRRDIGVLLYNNTLVVKVGTKQPSSAGALATDFHRKGSPATGFHQDGGSLPLDRNGRIAFWIALDHLTPEMGTVRYVDRSHHLGPLGYMLRDGQIQGSPFDLYPDLSEMTLTDPAEFQPGDATAHAMFTVHDAPVNESDRPRWVFNISYIPSDTVYTGAPTASPPNLKKIKRAAIQAGDSFGGPLYPRVFG